MNRRYWHLREMKHIPCPYRPERLVVTYFEGDERKRRWFESEEQAADFKAQLPPSARAIQHSN